MSTESSRASAEARRGVIARQPATDTREDYLLRYLGAMYYEARHGRAKREEVEQAAAHVDEYVSAHGPIIVPGGSRHDAGAPADPGESEGNS